MMSSVQPPHLDGIAGRTCQLVRKAGNRRPHSQQGEREERRCQGSNGTTCCCSVGGCSQGQTLTSNAVKAAIERQQWNDVLLPSWWLLAVANAEERRGQSNSGTTCCCSVGSCSQGHTPRPTDLLSLHDWQPVGARTEIDHHKQDMLPQEPQPLVGAHVAVLAFLGTCGKRQSRLTGSDASWLLVDSMGFRITLHLIVFCLGLRQGKAAIIFHG